MLRCMNDSQLFTEALDQFNTADMDLLEVVDYLVRTYNVSREKATNIAQDAEATFLG